jgi:hypothetical protein
VRTTLSAGTLPTAGFLRQNAPGLLQTPRFIEHTGLSVQACSVKVQVRDGAERRFCGSTNRPSPESDLASKSVVDVGSSELSVSFSTDNRTVVARVIGPKLSTERLHWPRFQWLSTARGLF